MGANLTFLHFETLLFVVFGGGWRGGGVVLYIYIFLSLDRCTMAEASFPSTVYYAKKGLIHESFTGFSYNVRYPGSAKPDILVSEVVTHKPRSSPDPIKHPSHAHAHILHVIPLVETQLCASGVQDFDLTLVCKNHIEGGACTLYRYQLYHKNILPHIECTRPITNPCSSAKKGNEKKSLTNTLPA